MPTSVRRVLLIDNFDSFTYNLVDYLRRLGCQVTVVRNTADPATLETLEFDLMLLSPGPSVPRQAGNLMAIIGRFAERKPIFGICLGLQALVEHFGGTIARVTPRHGKADPCTHDSRTLFAGAPPVLRVGRYHSWAAQHIPPVLEVSARAQDGTIMAIRHKTLPIEAVQFHPESILTMEDGIGLQLLRRVVEGALSNGFGDYRRAMHELQQPSAPPDELFERIVELIAGGTLTEDQRLVLLVALAFRLQQPEPLAQFVRTLLRRSPVAHISLEGYDPIDLCGTGGSGLPRLNTSTLTAFLLAHFGLPIVKHGNRAASGRTGSFDLLEALGIPPTVPVATALAALPATHLAFVFAPLAHPAVGQLAGARARVGIPTLFNVLGPLLNPLQPARQFIGTSFAEYQSLIFEAGIALGKRQLFVARAVDGLDEISVSVPTRILAYRDGRRGELQLSPADFGIDAIPFHQVSVANPAESLALAQAIAAGRLDSEHYRIVAANAAFCYQAFVEDVPLPEAYRRMVEAIRQGAIGRQIEYYRQSVGVTAPQPLAV